MISTISLVISMVALAACILIGISGMLSDGLKGIKKKGKPILILFLIYAGSFLVFLIGQ